MIAMVPMHVRGVQILRMCEGERERIEVFLVQQRELRSGRLFSQTGHLREAFSS